MSAFDTYNAYIQAKGGNKRNAAMQREERYILRHLVDSMSYHTAIVDGEERNVGIINSDNLNEKSIISMPGEDLRHGALVEWMDNRWLITDRDANTTLYCKCKMIQCNHLLKWINPDDEIIEQWAIVSDGTKYLTGEFEDKNFIATRGDTRLSCTISRTKESLRLNRQSRFIIDDPDSDEQLAYVLTKPLRMGWTYNNNGIFTFVLQEVPTTDYDNMELKIADYYKHFPDEYPAKDHLDDIPPTTEGKVWL